jgi:hypothetical protein
MIRRRIVLVLAAVFPIAAHAACSATNGDAIPSQVFDASALDVGANPDDTDAGNGGKDGATAKDGATDAPNDAPAETGPTNAAVAINELYVDQILDGDAAEFVELRAAAGTPVDDLKLRIVYANGTVKYEVSVGLAGEKFPASGLWVVGGNRTDKLNVLDHVDRTISLSMWGLDTRGAIQVVRGTTLLDVVGYTDDPDGGAAPAVPSPPTATVEGKPVVAPDNGSATTNTPRLTFGRKTGAADTNDNAADFCTMEASPGYPQKACK